MEWVETTGKSVDEAKNRALDQLGVAEDDAEIVVLDEPRAGLFGRVRGEARVRARVRPTTPRPKLDRRDRKKKDGRERTGRPDAETTADASAGPVPAGRDAVTPPGGQRKGKGSSADTRRAPAAGAGPLESSDVDRASSDDRADGRDSSAPTGGRRGRRGRRGGSGGTGDAPAANGTTTAGTGASEASTASLNGDHDPFAAAFEGESDARPAPPSGSRGQRGPRAERANAARGTTDAAITPAGSPASDSTEDRSDEIMVDAAQVGDEARRFVQGIVDAMGLTGTASVRQDGDDLEVAVDGADLGLLVGPRGSTLQALQELTRVAAQRRLGDHDTRLRVDVGGYRERRKEALGRFAQQVAGQVVAEGVAKRLEPMSSADRKVIHDVLSGVEGVTTRSEGDDPRRCVVIAPAHD
jgi:spoIIIJ-associated protein